MTTKKLPGLTDTDFAFILGQPYYGKDGRLYDDGVVYDCLENLVSPHKDSVRFPDLIFSSRRVDR